MVALLRSFRCGVAVSLLFSLAACAPSSYLVKEPAASALKYEIVGPPLAVTRLAFVDDRRGEERVFSTGLLPATLVLESGPVDPMQFLSKNVGIELNSRGLQTSTVVGNEGRPVIHVHTFRMLNHRASAFSPFFTSTYLSADIETPQGPRRIAAFVRRGKVPVWSFAEVIDPTFNQPLSLAVKEFSSKLASALYSYKASDTTVKELVAKVSGTPAADTFLDVYALGFTNNPAAIDTLLTLTKSSDEYVRLAAISSLGNLRATGQFGLLKSIYQDVAASSAERDMALKAIADLGSPESETFIRAEIKQLSAKGDTEAQWTSRMLALYL
jgi:hypothetical protein